jgi:hypothetical protein
MALYNSDSAILLEATTNLKIKSLYVLMDAAFSLDHIKAYITGAVKVAFMGPKKPKRSKKISIVPAENACTKFAPP